MGMLLEMEVKMGVGMLVGKGIGMLVEMEVKMGVGMRVGKWVVMGMLVGVGNTWCRGEGELVEPHPHPPPLTPTHPHPPPIQIQNIY
jgi:hypothetical protein